MTIQKRERMRMSSNGIINTVKVKRRLTTGR